MTGDRAHILVTGGFGNLGSWICDFLLREHYTVSILSNSEKDLFPGQRKNIIRCDIGDRVDCIEKLSGRSFDQVIHLASYNENFEKNYFEKAYRVNTLGTRNLLEALDRTTIKNFIYFSTVHVYGSSGTSFTENSPAKPENDYAATHYFAEEIIRQFHRANDLPFTILRLSNSYGMPIDMETNKWYLLFNDLVRSAVEKGQLQLNTNGQPLRDYIWMGDVCSAIGQLLELPASNEVFNLSSGNSKTVLEIATEIQLAYKNVHGKEVAIHTNANDHNQYNTVLKISNDKLSKLIRLTPREKFREEAERMILTLKKE